MKLILQKISKLIDVKTILTVMLGIFFCWGFVNGKISSEQFVSITTMCFTFFFSYQSNKNSGSGES